MLANVRASLNRTGPLPKSVTRGLENRLKRPTANLLPKWDEEPLERFVAKMSAVSGQVTRVANMGRVAAAVMKHLDAHDLPPAIVVAPDPRLEDIAWSNRLTVSRRAAEAADRVSVTAAYAAVAETGSLVLLSGAESPTTLNFLPEDHIVVLRESQILRQLEDVWAALRKERKSLPRAVNVITGPSKTADVEQTLQEGAHGPRRLHVILVDD
jgi:L-lactate dehydrogenase complex protein LldG